MNYQMSGVGAGGSAGSTKNLKVVSCRVTFVGNYATMGLTLQIRCTDKKDIKVLAIKEAESLALEYYGIDISESGLNAVKTVVEILD